MNIVKSTSKIFVVKLINAVLGFIGIVYFARILGSAELGIFFLFQAVHGMLSIPADFGINNAIKKRLSEGIDQSRMLGTAVLTKFVSISIVSILVILAADYINSYLGVNWALYIIISLGLQQFSKLFISALHGELRVGETAIIKLAKQVSWLAGGILFVSIDYGAVGLVYAFMISEVVAATWAFYRIKTPLGWPKINHVQSIYDYSRFSFISSIGGYAYSWVDVLIIGFFLTSSHVAAYEIAWRVTAIVVLFSRSIAITIFPQVSSWDSNNAQIKIQNMLPRAVTAAVFLAIPAFFGSVVLSTEILEFIFGTEYTIASLALIILMGEKIFQSAHKVLGYSLQAIDRPDLAAYAAISSLVANIILNFSLVPLFGIAGAASATATAFLLNTFLHAIFLSRRIKIKFEIKKIVWCLNSAAIMMLVLLLAKMYFPVDSLGVLVIYIFAGIFSYFISILLYKPIKQDMYFIISDISK